MFPAIPAPEKPRVFAPNQRMLAVVTNSILSSVQSTRLLKNFLFNSGNNVT